jgi:hypothetical protein
MLMAGFFVRVNTLLVTKGEYGYVQDWNQDPERASLYQAAAGGSPDLQPWLRDRLRAFDSLLEEYSGDNLDKLERIARTLFQPSPVE